MNLLDLAGIKPKTSLVRIINEDAWSETDPRAPWNSPSSNDDDNIATAEDVDMWGYVEDTKDPDVRRFLNTVFPNSNEFEYKADIAVEFEDEDDQHGRLVKCSFSQGTPLEKAYNQASPELQKKVKAWLGQELVDWGDFGDVVKNPISSYEPDWDSMPGGHDDY
jgi:hypothetical protein